MKKYLFSFLLAAGLSASASNELLMPAPPISVSPSTASLSEPCITSVNLYLGTPSIELPLVSLNVGGGHSWPISIVYSCNGIKPFQPAGIVGAGWAMKSSGVITASRHDLPDEQNFINLAATNLHHTNVGWYYQHKLADIPFDNSSSILSTLSYYARTAYKLDDTEPDVFNFSFLDYNGTFFLGEDGEWKVRCNKDVKVLFGGKPDDYADPYEFIDLHTFNTRDYLLLSNGAYSKSFGRFKIIDENGNSYIFGGNNESIEYHIPFFTVPGDKFVASAWYLTEVIYADGRTVRFKYSSDRPYIANMSHNQSEWAFHPLSSVNCSAYSHDSPTYGGNLIVPVYLTDITSDEDSVSLEYSIDNSKYYDFRMICDNYKYKDDLERYLPLLQNYVWQMGYTNYEYPDCLKALCRKKLAAITYFQMHERHHSLNFSYEEGNYLILSSITDDILGNKYSFENYETDKLPSLSCEEYDAWGYYKGYDYTSQQSRASQYGMLEKINYSTNGYTRFEYERNDYSSTVSELRNDVLYEPKNKIGGGLRVKRIYQNSTNDNSSEFLDKEYYYVKNYRVNGNSSTSISTGCLLQPPLYTYSFNAYTSDGNRHNVSFSTVKSLACHDDSGHEGPVGYSEVAEKNADGTLNIYKFIDFSTVADERPVAEILEANGIKPCSYRSHERGLVKEISKYLPDGKLWKQTVYKYAPSENRDNAFVKCLHIWGKYLCYPNTNTWVYDGVAYKRYYYVMRPNSIEETEYDDKNNSFTTTTYLYYVPGMRGLVESSHKYYANKREITRYKYCFEDDIQRKYRNILAPLAEENLTLLIYSPYYFNNKIASTYYHYPSSFDFYPDSVWHSGYKGQPQYIEKYSYGQYCCIQSCQRTGSPQCNYIWSHNGLRPIAEYTGNNIGLCNLTVNQDYPSIVTKLRERDYSLHKYDYFGRLIESERNGVYKVGYEYDEANRLSSEYINDTYSKGYQYYTALGYNPGPRPEYGSANEDYNFILTNSIGATDYDHQVDYYDGLGRMTESVKVGFGADNEDNISIIENNPNGTLAKSYLPVPVPNNNGAYTKTNNANFSIYGDDKDFAYTSYKYSGRKDEPPVNIRLPGMSWHNNQGKNVHFSLVMNPGKYPVFREGKLIVASDEYGKGELRMRETIDEDGKKTCEIKNRHDLVVRTITSTDSVNIVTGYVYDEKDNLRYVLPPAVMARVLTFDDWSPINDTELTDMCYIYTYDERNRLVTKKLPHCNAETYYYDDQNLLRLSQSAAQSVNDRWSFYSYDDMYRQVYKYTFRPGPTPYIKLIQTLLQQPDGCQYDTYDPADSHDFYGYKPWNKLFKFDIPANINDGEIEWINFYDGITPGNVLPEHADSLAFQRFESNGSSVLFRGELSGRLTRVPADSTFIAEAIYHDSRGRIIQSVSSNILGGYDRTSTIYTPNDLPLKVFESHSTPKESHRDVYSYTYGPWSRLMSLSMTHDDEPTKELLSNTYDALGRIASQTVGGNVTTDYTYHLHGGISTTSNSHFSQKLYYEKGPDSSAGYLNGNISSYHWSASADGTGPSTLWRSYTYSYDGADRLTSAVYGESGSRHDDIFVNSPDYSEYRSYDLNSNLLSLKTYGLTDRQKLTNGTSLSFGVIKDIRFDNVGSQMLAATIAPTSSTVSTMDNSVIGALKEETTFGFSYDAAGNLTSDGLRRQTFEYDRFGHLSYALPESGKKNSSIANYTYDASGRLHKRMMETEQLKADLQLPLQPSLPDSLITITPVFPKDSIKLFSGTAPASKAASLPGILWPPVSDRDSMTAIQAFTIQTPYEYCGNYEYIRGKLSRINTPTGYYENGRHYFYVKDYQGNVRCTVSDNDSLTKAVHYYPGGSLFGESYGYYFWSGNNLFQGGKLEKSDAHTFYDLQNRHYDPILPHFISVDSKSESYYPFSFYNYALCNPIRYRDPDGNDAEANVRGYTIIITADIYIYNSEYIHKKSATQDLVQLALLYQKAIDSTWGQQTQYEYNGVTYNIVWNINVKIKKINQILQQDGTSNFLFVMHKNIDPNKYPSEVTSCWKGKISSKRIHEISHELGHMLGLRDRYNSKTKKSYNGWENNIMGSENGIIDSRNLSGIIDPILENYHGTEMQKNALKHTWLNKLRIWDYNHRIDSHNREENPY